MHARVTLAQVRPGELHQTMGLLKDSLYPAFAQMQGFKGALLLTNPATEKVAGITFWETKLDIPHVTEMLVETNGRHTRRFFEANPLEQLATIPLAGQPGREIYEVSVRVESYAGGDPVHAKVLTARGQPGMMDEVTTIARDSVVPVLKQQKGFKSYIVLTQDNTGKECVITLWEKEVDERNWEIDSRHQELAARINLLIVGPPTVERYAVTVQA